MCGKFRAKSSWRRETDFSRPPPSGGDDEIVIYRPATILPVIVFDKQTGKRVVVPMRWGFPHRDDYRRPDPIHVRAETIDEKPTFKDAFLGARRGIVVMQTFNAGRELPNGKTEQWTIDPGDGIPRGFAFLWRRFEVRDLPAPLFCCVMATVPASELIRPVTERMPAILEDGDWPIWLGERPATPGEAKAVLKTMKGVDWRLEREAKPSRRKT